MSPSHRTTPRHAGLAAAAYLLVLAATVGWGVTGWVAIDELRAEIEAKQHVLAEFARRAATQAPARADTARSQMHEGAAIPAPTETVAASALQKQILERLETAGGTVHSVQAEPVKDASPDASRRLVAQLTFDCSIAGLQRLLFELETGVPFVFVDSLAVQPATSPVPGARMGDRLRVALSVSSYWMQK
jgi:general secretion pathway protein M